MTLSISHRSFSSKSLNLVPSQNEVSLSKSLGGAAGTDPALAEWVEQNRYVYDAIMSGISNLSPTDQNQFMEWWSWAMTQMNGSEGSQWDPLGETGAGEQNGTQGNTVYDDVTSHVTYSGDPGPYDVYSFDFILDVPSTAVDVMVEKTTDSRLQPPETDVIKITLKNKATGVETVYFVHNSEDINSIKINTPNALHIDDKTGDNRIETGKYIEGGMEEGGGIPENAQVEGDTATYDGIAGDMMEFTPPFGGIPKHVVYSDANISCRNSDEVLVEKVSNGGYRVTVTDLDGNRTVFTVPEGFHLNVNAHAPNVTFKEGGKVVDDLSEGGVTGGLDALTLEDDGEPQRVNPGTEGSDGVPVGWENFSLNGVEAPVEENPENMPAGVQALADELGMAADEIPEKFWDDIQYQRVPPPQALLDFLAKHDPELKDALNNPKLNDDGGLGKLAWQAVQSRLAVLLSAAYEDGVQTNGDYPEGVIPSDRDRAQTIFLKGIAFKIGDGLILTPFEDVASEGGTIHLDPPVGEAEYEDMLAAANRIRSDLGISMSAEDLVMQAWNDHGLDLSELSLPPTKKLWDFLLSVDENLAEAYSDLAGVYLDFTRQDSGEATEADLNAELARLRDQIVQTLQALFPDQAISSGGTGGENSKHNDDIIVDGQRIDIFRWWEEDGVDYNSSNPFSWFHWENVAE
jgi:hypothetical protein